MTYVYAHDPVTGKLVDTTSFPAGYSDPDHIGIAAAIWAACGYGVSIVSAAMQTHRQDDSEPKGITQYANDVRVIGQLMPDSDVPQKSKNLAMRLTQERVERERMQEHTEPHSSITG